MDSNDICTILNLKQGEKRVLVNDRFLCHFDKTDIGKAVFPEMAKDENCPRLVSIVKSDVYDYQHFSHEKADVMIAKDLDLGDDYMSMTLTFDKTEKHDRFQVNAISVEIQDQPLQLSELLAKIDIGARYEDKEPIDSLGLAIVEFPVVGSLHASLENGIDGRVYYEVIDYSKWKEGELLPLDSDLRKDVIRYEPLRRDTIDSIAARINASLHNMHNTTTKNGEDNDKD